MKLAIQFLLIIAFPLISVAQENRKQSEKRLLFYMGLSYSFQSSDYTNEGSNLPSPGFVSSPSIDFYFTLQPRRPDGWHIQYNNLVVGEIITNGIFDLLGIKSGPPLIDHTITTGIAGRFDFGKILPLSENKWLTMGFVLSDKYVTGIYFEPDDKGADIYRDPDGDGYFIAPGFFIEHSKTTKKFLKVSLYTSFTQSVFNMWSIGSDINYKNHLFNETNLNLFTPKGWYFNLGTIIVIPYSDYSAKCRFSITVGHLLFKH